MRPGGSQDPPDQGWSEDAHVVWGDSYSSESSISSRSSGKTRGHVYPEPPPILRLDEDEAFSQEHIRKMPEPVAPLWSRPQEPPSSLAGGATTGDRADSSHVQRGCNSLPPQTPGQVEEKTAPAQSHLAAQRAALFDNVEQRLKGPPRPRGPGKGRPPIAQGAVKGKGKGWGGRMAGVPFIPGQRAHGATWGMVNEATAEPSQAIAQPMVPPGHFFHDSYEAAAATAQTVAGSSSSSGVDA